MTMSRWNIDPRSELIRADEAISRALQTNPNDAMAHLTKGEIFRAQKRFDDAIAEYERAIADNRNLAAAYAQIGGTKTLNGRAQEAFEPVERAMRLSPRDPLLNVWLFYIGHAHTHLAQDDDAIEWCRKSIAVAPYWLAYIDLASAYAWKGEQQEARQAVQELLTLMPGYTCRSGRLPAFPIILSFSSNLNGSSRAFERPDPQNNDRSVETNRFPRRRVQAQRCSHSSRRHGVRIAYAPRRVLIKAADQCW